MGGGAAMRSAAKVTGFGIQSTLRGATIVPPVEQPVRKASIPVSAVISSSSASQSVKAASDVVTVQRPSWELDDWEFADGDELVMSAGEPMPRVVFGGVPSFQEAKEATAELKDALDKVYLSSPKSSGSAEQVTTDQVAGMSLFSHTDSETKSCLIFEKNSSDSTPKHALQAFKFLSGSTEAQSVVASIACDPNVWNAVMQNSVLKQFIDSQQTVDEFQDPASPKKFEEDLSDDSSQSGDSGNGFMKNMLQNIKFRVMNMVNNVSSFLHDIFEPSSDCNGDTKSTFIDRNQKTVLGLAVLVIMVVVLKRI
ncbi:hypothetical protein FNV43_RR03998 [Rhamnella rubrinervis]|uniref:Uncharacterized protein n=1 Tax=Rhamnella rubrinervis TaxID=2594499 RepID=A0A8K0HK70_9ROSA|nr:hypothetical protein FNV43_RR03998 [Rhamnella rubrinervis]